MAHSAIHFSHQRMSTELIVDVTGEEAQVKPRVVPVVPSASLDAITGVRFLAAAGVVLYHFALPIVKPKSLLLSNLVGAGYTAVDLFFLLSGFILSYSYINLDGRMRGSRRNFYVSRFARIYPAYLVGFLWPRRQILPQACMSIGSPRLLRN